MRELTALDTAYQKQAPILMYFWTPHWAQQKYDLTNGRAARGLRAVQADAATGENADQYNCAYAPDPLYKAFNDELADEGSRGVRVPERRSRTRPPIRTDLHWTSTTG